MQPTSKPPEPAHKRIFWLVPNYRTFPTLAHYRPLTAGAKFKIATQDTFDPGTFALAAVFAGYGQLTNASPSFGQGAAGYAKYFGASFADWSIGDYMTEGIYPAMLHQDPRYFRKGQGSGASRLLWAVKQIFWTRQDSGRGMFNFSEIGGSATGVAISQLYYPDNRSAADAASKLSIQVGLDMASNVLKEFWPDIANRLSRKQSQSAH